MINYIKKHWRGELSLAQSWWVNTVLLIGATKLIVPVLEPTLSLFKPKTGLFILLCAVGLFAAILIWQLVGTWRSAHKTASQSGKPLLPYLAKGAVILVAFGGAWGFRTVTTDLLTLLDQTDDPRLAGFTLEREGSKDVVLRGALNRQSVDAAIQALKDPEIRVLRIDSPGGYAEPAWELAQIVGRTGTTVVAEGQCISACVWVFWASSNPAVYAGTPIVFHGFRRPSELKTPTLQQEHDRALEESKGRAVLHGVPDWVIDILETKEFWAPTYDELIQMGRLAQIYDPETDRFVKARSYCAGARDLCEARPEIGQ